MISASHVVAFASNLGIVTGNPRVILGYLYPYPPKTRTRAPGYGFLRVRVAGIAGQAGQKTRVTGRGFSYENKSQR